MRYVKIKPHADCPRSPCGRLIFVECGLPCADGHKPVFILHEGEELNIPAWAAAELTERGHEILEVNEIRDGEHVALPGVAVDHVDIAKEIAAAPHHEVDRFLRHHGFHEHLVEPAAPEIKSNMPGVAASLGHRLKPVDFTPDALRSKALELHHARVAERQRGKTKGK